mmetsp:Transcript_20551/g.44948  ORF Transcript_20551/g.44948 Transcript_20551/m.44948 type:complete len:316 (-) Transcript_20551:440-1387(-)
MESAGRPPTMPRMVSEPLSHPPFMRAALCRKAEKKERRSATSTGTRVPPKSTISSALPGMGLCSSSPSSSSAAISMLCCFHSLSMKPCHMEDMTSHMSARQLRSSSTTRLLPPVSRTPSAMLHAAHAARYRSTAEAFSLVATMHGALATFWSARSLSSACELVEDWVPSRPVKAYTQRTSVSFWARTALIPSLVRASANSDSIIMLCPRPTGVKASAAVKPVCMLLSMGKREGTSGGSLIRCTTSFASGFLSQTERPTNGPTTEPQEVSFTSKPARSLRSQVTFSPFSTFASSRITQKVRGSRRQSRIPRAPPLK